MRFLARILNSCGQNDMSTFRTLFDNAADSVIHNSTSKRALVVPLKNLKNVY